VATRNDRDEVRVDIRVAATALCISNEGNHPKGGEKASIRPGPVPGAEWQGRVLTHVDRNVLATCSAPMMLAWTDVLVPT
jgi:hypothetical protein